MTNITHLLECDFETFKTEYDQRRNDIMVEAAYTMARKLDGPIEEMDQNTATQLIAGERAVSLTDGFAKIAHLPEKHPVVKAFKTKEFFDDIKWTGCNPRLFITPATLRLIWEGDDPAVKANRNPRFAELPQHGQAKTVVSEHVYPSSQLKKSLLGKRFHGAREIMGHIARRNIISFTAYSDDVKLNVLYKDSLPERANPFSRYDALEIKVFPLQARFDGSNKGHDRVIKQLPKEAAAAKENGLTFEEWVATIIEL